MSESFADGQAKREVSAAQLETIYNYGIHNFGGGGLWQLAQTGARWTKSYSDFAGRVFHQEGPSFGGGTVATESTYNLLGQLVSVTQPGLAPMLHEYNALGERIRSTLDVNNNGAVGFDGTDRITENETHVVASATVGGLTIAPARVSVSRVDAGLRRLESRRRIQPAGPARHSHLVMTHPMFASSSRWCGSLESNAACHQVEILHP